MTPEDDAPSFLDRWSRRKQTQREDSVGKADDTKETVAPAGTDEADAESSAPLSEEEIAQLPSTEDLTYDSDFKTYLREGVPEALKRQALRQLWRSNPVLANLDGLAEYDEDFTGGGVLAGTLQTAYKAGKGYFDKEAEQREAAAREADAAASAASAETDSDDTDPEAGPAAQEEVGGRRAEAHELTDDRPGESEEKTEVTEVMKTSTDVESPDAELQMVSSGRPQRSAEPGSALRRRWGNRDG